MPARCGHFVTAPAGHERPFMASMCETCEAEHAARVQRARVQRALARRRGGAGIPVAYHGATLADLGERGWPGDVLLAAHAWTQQGGGLFLYGPTGTGKSTLAAAAAWELAERMEVRWVRAAQLARWALDDFDSPEYRGHRDVVNSTSALVLDDLGQEMTHEAAIAAVKEAIEGRVLAGAPLLVTSNRTIPQLSRREGYEAWLASRLAGYCRQYTMAGPDHRIDHYRI